MQDLVDRRALLITHLHCDGKVVSADPEPGPVGSVTLRSLSDALVSRPAVCRRPCPEASSHRAGATDSPRPGDLEQARTCRR